ncbi:MAG TPA: capsule assembly Wzi family protein [Cyclobacteriaceae bacterium]|nr:capsule assembly Wzi family protein [Cyclobacteriaceae bacterium]
MQKGALIFWLVILITGNAFSQSTNASLNEDYYHWLDRYEVKAGRVVPELFTTVKPYKRSDIAAYIDSLMNKYDGFTDRAGGDTWRDTDIFNYDYLRNDSWEWTRATTSDSKKPLLKHFYRKKSDFLHVDQPDFDLHISPVLYAGLGKDSERSGTSFINTRGIELRSMIDKKVGVYMFFTENQAVLPMYVDRELSNNPVIPHEGFWKRFKDNGVDFFQARGYIDAKISKHIYAQLGHDRMFIGNGVRSLIWSDNAPPQLYLRANVKVWKLNYLFQINRMVADVTGSANGTTNGKYPEKYVAFHHASFNVGKKLNFGFFESVVFSPQDSVNGDKASFEWNYVNPVIFYRAIEQQFGSADNAIVGADAKWNIVRGVSMYGQFVLDEFYLKHIRARDGWWANKFAGQLGVKYIDAFAVPNLDLQIETNFVRPYTYSHGTNYASYTNYRQPIAHPLGANFRELIGVARYQPIGKLNIVAKLMYAKGGVDLPGDNWGGNLLKNNSTREMELGNKIGQGVPYKRTLMSLTASYMVKHNVFVDLQLISRKNNYDIGNVNTLVSGTSNITSLALRWNIARRNYDF